MPHQTTTAESIDPKKISGIIEVSKMLANKYREYTGKPLGITGEVGEYEAAAILGLKLATARTPGHDAKDGRGKRYQIKTRVILPGSKPGQRLGSIKLDERHESVRAVHQAGGRNGSISRPLSSESASATIVFITGGLCVQTRIGD